MSGQTTTASYDGAGPFPKAGAPGEIPAGRLQLTLTAVIVVAPFVALTLAVWLLWGHGIALHDVLIAVAFYAVTGLGVTVGFHRLITHGGYTAHPRLRIALAVAGSMSFQGDIITWVATHRQHHAFTDRPGDPHSPYRFGTSPRAQLRGLAHAHLGWMLGGGQNTSVARYAPDLLADPAMVKMARAFPALCLVSLGLPALAGWAITGSWYGALTAFLWAGLVRVGLLQHVTWSINSLCHMVGTRPFATRRFDRSTNFWPLALLSFGESWHNGHHSDPTCARHGVDPHQLDISAGLIRLFERLGWATDVRWPDPSRVANHRRREDHGQLKRAPAAVRSR